MARPKQVSVWVGRATVTGAVMTALAAFAPLRDPASKTFYDRKRTEGKRRNAALICLARRRFDVILAILRTGQPCQPARPATGLAEAA